MCLGALEINQLNSRSNLNIQGKSVKSVPVSRIHFYTLALVRDVIDLETSCQHTCILFTMLKLLYVSEPSKAPVLTNIKVLNSTSIQLKWEPVPREFTHGIITKYVILYTDDEKETDNKTVLASPLIAVVNGLGQSTTYSFQVLAATVKGNGPASDPKSGTTKGEVI